MIAQLDVARILRETYSFFLNCVYMLVRAGKSHRYHCKELLEISNNAFETYVLPTIDVEREVVKFKFQSLWMAGPVRKKSLSRGTAKKFQFQSDVRS